MKTKELSKEDRNINLLNLLCVNIITRFDELEESGLIFHKQKQKGKAFIKELEKLSNVICSSAKEENEKVYNESISVFHKFNNKLDTFLKEL